MNKLAKLRRCASRVSFGPKKFEPTPVTNSLTKLDFHVDVDVEVDVNVDVDIDIDVDVIVDVDVDVSHHVGRHVGHHVGHLVGHHVHLDVGHHNVVSMGCEGSETQTEWKSEIILRCFVRAEH